MNIKTDIVIMGTGASGLFSALCFPADKKILMITKASVEESDSYLAQGGICVLKSDDDYDSFFEDTMKAGHYENDTSSVETMIRTSPEIIKNLIEYGVQFEKKNGELIYTKEGAHSKPRILYHDDITGKEITSKLLSQVKKRKNIEIIEYMTMIDIIKYNNICAGIVAKDKDEKITAIESDYVILAAGGLGGLYEHSTNFSHLTGDAIAIAIKNNIELENINYIQFHPTAFYSKEKGRKFLISESVRGEGAVLYNKNMERFVYELLPRDVVTKAIQRQMEKDNTEFVWLSMVDIGSEKIKKRFPNIYKYCLKHGYDVTRECIPVTPAQHYLMGGIKVDLNSNTSMDHLYAVGETSCNRVHGANRLASNSLLESLVFAKRAALNMMKNYEELSNINRIINFDEYYDLKKLEEKYKSSVTNEIERRNFIDKSNKSDNDEA